MAFTEVEIKYKKRGVNYRVVMAAENLDAFKEAARVMGGAANATGEDLVSAIKAAMPFGKLRKIHRFINGGELNDGPDGQPGSEFYGNDGTLAAGAHYKGGKWLASYEGDEAIAIEKAEETRGVEAIFAKKLKVLAPK